MRADRLLAGVDVGATKIAAGVADERGRVLASRRIATPPEGGTRVLDRIVELLEAVFADIHADPPHVAAIGIAVPAVIDRRDGAVLWAPNIPGWQQRVEVTRPISEAFGCTASVHYDGHAWVMGEWWRGAARGAGDVALVAVGSGVGGGLILDGRLHLGRVGVAGALGWWQLEWRRAGGAGPAPHHLEALASGPALAAAAGKETAQEAFEAARKGDPDAGRAVERAACALGLAAANLVSLVDPEIVVLAGGVIVGGADLLLPRIQQLVREAAQPQIARSVRVVAAELGEEAAWLGAARLGGERIDAKKEGAD